MKSPKATSSREEIPLYDLTSSNSSPDYYPDMIGLESDTPSDLETANNTPLTRWQRFVNGPEYPSNDPAPPITWLEWGDKLAAKFNSQFSVTAKSGLLLCYLLLWFGINYQVTIPYLVTPPIPSDPTDDTPVVVGWCDTSELWLGKNQRCGMNGTDCPAVADASKDIYLRCPALCHLSKQYSLLPVGDQRIKYRPYVIGGGSDIKEDIDTPDNYTQLTNPYRGDSNPCVAAAHAGLTSEARGGVVRLSYSSGPQTHFDTARGKEGTGNSIDFDSYFPSSFYFKSMGDASISQSKDPRFPLLALNIIMGIPIVVLGSASVAYWVITILAFWTIVFSEDPVSVINPADIDHFNSMISKGCERFLPTCFILFVMYKYSVGFTLGHDKNGPHESTMVRLISWYPMFWIGALNNITFDRLPMDRFSWDALSSQPGGVLSMLVLVGVVIIGAFIQAYQIWKTGKFWSYLKFYLLVIGGLVLVILMPGLKFHLHHYIIGLLLLPGCATRNITGLLFSGILLGLFISGASRWGLDSILETATQWARDDPIGTIVPPEIIAYDNATGVLTWERAAMSYTSKSVVHNFTEVSLVVNDIEMWKGSGTEMKLANILPQKIIESNNIPVYLRMARVNPRINEYSDYSNAAVLHWPSGNLTLAVPGLT